MSFGYQPSSPFSSSSSSSPSSFMGYGDNNNNNNNNQDNNKNNNNYNNGNNMNEPQSPPSFPSSPSSSSSSPSPSSLFACVIPGRPISFNFTPISETRLLHSLPLSSTISEFTICLMQPVIPVESSVGVYYSCWPYEEWNYIGKLHVNHPTAAFRAPWYGKGKSNNTNNNDDSDTIQIGLSLEPSSSLSTQSGTEEKESELSLESAQGIAKDLFNYMSSYSQMTGKYKELGDVLVIPTDCITKWFEKFKKKHMMEPYFWMKKDVNKY